MPDPHPTDDGRQQVLQRLQQLLESGTQGASRIACVVIHIRNIRHIRSLIGDAGAETFLQVLREKLNGITRNTQRVIDSGYDHFVLILPGIMNAGHARLAAQKIDLVLRNPAVVGERLIEPEFALGLALLPDHAEDASQLLARAEVALLAAEDAGLTHALFDVSQLTEMTQSWEFDHELRDALHGNALMAYYQPQVDLTNGRIHGVEALARWEHPEKGFISPGEFIPAAERAGLIPRLSDAILKQVLQDHAALMALGIPVVSVNLSALDLEDRELGARVQQQLAIWGVPAHTITFEITESCILQGSDVTRRQIEKLHALGCGLSIDDFGTGYSSLSNFKTIPANEIKIDGSFVGNIESDSTNRDIVAIALELANRFGLKAVAEGVETEAAARVLREMGCGIGQGYLYARPLPLAQLRAWCAERTQREAR